MLKKSFFIIGFLCLSIYNVSAQSSIEPICEVYGTVQGVYFDAFKKSCSTASSSEACNEVLQKLNEHFNAATLTRKDYSQANVQGCKIVLKTVEDGIYFAIEGSANIIKQVKEELNSFCVSSCG